MSATVEHLLTDRVARRPASRTTRMTALQRHAQLHAVRDRLHRAYPRATTSADRARIVRQLRYVNARLRADHRRGVMTERPARRTIVRRPVRGIAAVVAFARAQIGKPYAPGGSGPHAFDCSGFTMQAYRRAGIRLPHSSGAQAARAYTVRRSTARPGDLVVGPGHVGVYMGRGMMVDAGNRRVGVVYRPLYRGLWIERLV